jgi:hypothetical protein
MHRNTSVHCYAQKTSAQCYAQEHFRSVLCTVTLPCTAIHRNTSVQCYAEKHFRAVLCTKTLPCSSMQRHFRAVLCTVTIPCSSMQSNTTVHCYAQEHLPMEKRQTSAWNLTYKIPVRVLVLVARRLEMAVCLDVRGAGLLTINLLLIAEVANVWHHAVAKV